MTVYNNRCGEWTLELSDPSPMWVSLGYEGEQLPRMRSSELYDLRHLVDRAIVAAEARERDLRRSG